MAELLSNGKVAGPTIGDLFGFEQPKLPFSNDIRNQRESVAEEKARLAFELNKLVKTPPKTLNSASINTVRAWFETQKMAAKVLSAKDSSRTQLLSAINSMQRYCA